jgi:3-hydroxyacyl-[acyl-carrier-protein] dehydratase
MRSLLSGDFFTITSFTYDEETPEKLEAKVNIHADHSIFAGHFPGNPVVPGVCIIQMIKETLSQHFCKELILVRADEVKFLNIINPLLDPDIEMEFKLKHPGDELVHANVIIKNDDKVFMKFRGSFR